MKKFAILLAQSFLPEQLPFDKSPMQLLHEKHVETQSMVLSLLIAHILTGRVYRDLIDHLYQNWVLIPEHLRAQANDEFQKYLHKRISLPAFQPENLPQIPKLLLIHNGEQSVIGPILKQLNRAFGDEYPVHIIISDQESIDLAVRTPAPKSFQDTIQTKG